MASLAAVGFSSIWLVEDQQTALRLLPALLLCLALQQGDVYVHLGLNWRLPDGSFREGLGVPTTLTLARGVLANLLLAHLLSGVIPPSSLSLGILLIGSATDIADGQIARYTGWQTRLGEYVDSEADLYLSVSVTLSALVERLLPPWVAILMLLRFALPVVGAVLSYFVAIRPVHLTHTALGRCTGAAQVSLLIMVLAPYRLLLLRGLIYPPLLVGTLVLLLVTPLIEVSKNVVLWRAQK
jgi:phosphatidylglycerophosphate synthase